MSSGAGTWYTKWVALSHTPNCLVCGDKPMANAQHIISTGAVQTAEGQEALHQRLSDGVVRALESLREDGGAGGGRGVYGLILVCFRLV